MSYITGYDLYSLFIIKTFKVKSKQHPKTDVIVKKFVRGNQIQNQYELVRVTPQKDLNKQPTKPTVAIAIELARSVTNEARFMRSCGRDIDRESRTIVKVSNNIVVCPRFIFVLDSRNEDDVRI